MKTSIERDKRPTRVGNRTVWIAAVVVFNVLLIAWTLLQPAGSQGVTSTGGVVGPLLAVLLCFWGFGEASRRDGPRSGRRWVPVLLGLGILSYTLGRMLRQASFRTGGGADTLKVWAHRITPGGNSEGLEGLLRVRQGHETRLFDLKLSGGQVILPVAGGDCEVDITFAGTDGAGSSDRLP